MKKCASHDKEKIMNLFPKNYKPKEYEPKKIVSTFDENYAECKSEGDGQLSREEYVQNRPYLRDMLDNLRTFSDWKCSWQ